MSIIVDTGVFVASVNERDKRHKPAKNALKAILTGRFGKAYTSDYILDESVTLARKRTKSHQLAMTIANKILGRASYPQVFGLLMMTGPTFRESLHLFELYSDQDLSFTDAATIALIRRRGIDHVLSFDADFDGLVDRLDPKNL